MRYSGGFFKGNRSAMLNDFDAATYGLYWILEAWALIKDAKVGNAGQIVTSAGELAEKLKIHPRTVRLKLDILEKAGLINQQIMNKKGRIITLSVGSYDTKARLIRAQVADHMIPSGLDHTSLVIKNKKEKNIKKREKGKLSLELEQFIARYQELYTEVYLFKSGLKESDIEFAEEVIGMVGYEAAVGALPYYFQSKRQFYTDQRNSLRIFWMDLDVFTSRWARDRRKMDHGQTQMPAQTSS